MRSGSPTALPRLPFGRRGGALLAMAAVGLFAAGCARERREITPSTLGTDLKRMPRGRMTPYPWPGQSIVRAPARTGGPTVDPDASMASGGLPDY
jgi:hypothetical protein